jgi:hypothetical protein
MSVKFQQDTIRTTTGVRPEDLAPHAHDLAHKVGERLTGGNTHTGYLAVCRTLTRLKEGIYRLRVLMDRDMTGLLEAAAGIPPSHEDAHIRCALRFAGIRGLVARPRYQQAWPLLQLPRAEDGALRNVRQRAHGPRSDRNLAEDLFGPVELEGQDSPDSG